MRALLRNRPLLVFMLGHFTVDMYGGILPILFPVLSDDFDLSNASVGMIALAFTGAASLSQPLFGYLADRFGSRSLAVSSLAWSAVSIGLIGFAPSYWVVIALALAAGLGSGAYHPQGASNASAAAGDTGRNSALAFYTVGGTSGFALAPLIGAAALYLLGRNGTVLLIPFGLIVAVALYQQLKRLGLGLAQHHALQKAAVSSIHWAPLVLVVCIVMLRSWVFFSAVNFIPLWFDEQGYSTRFYSLLATAFLGFGALGTLSGGFLADRFGQRRILMISLFSSTPAMVIFTVFPGPQSLVLGPLFAFLADMSLSITLVMAQRFLPGRVGMASGFILGMGFVTGGIGVPITGYFADQYGIGTALMLSSVLVLLAGVLASMLPRRTAPESPAVSPTPAD